VSFDWTKLRMSGVLKLPLMVSLSNHDRTKLRMSGKWVLRQAQDEWKIGC
jgi:hypothetical protein